MSIISYLLKPFFLYFGSFWPPEASLGLPWASLGLPMAHLELQSEPMEASKGGLGRILATFWTPLGGPGPTF